MRSNIAQCYGSSFCVVAFVLISVVCWAHWIRWFRSVDYNFIDVSRREFLQVKLSFFQCA